MSSRSNTDLDGRRVATTRGRTRATFASRACPHCGDQVEVGTVGRGFVADWVVATLTTALLTLIAAVAAVVVTLRLIDLSRAE